MKPLIIGQSPARMQATHKAFDQPSGMRLAGAMGLPTVLHIHRLFECRNLMDWYPGRYLRADTIPSDMAQLAGRHAVPDLRGRVVLILGRPVASAMGLDWMHWLKWTEVYGGKVALAPHPSAASQWWKNPEAVIGVREFLRRFVTATQEGGNDERMDPSDR